MLKEPSPQQYQFETVTLDELVPEDHLVRQVDAIMDFEFIRDAVAHLYCPNNGRPAIDPVRLIKMMLLGYLFGVPSERKLVKEIQVNMAYRWFLRMGLTEKVPDASTLSQNRLRRFNNSDVFQQIFDHVVEQAISGGMANGRVLYTDSTHLKADANPRKAINEERPIAPSSFSAAEPKASRNCSIIRPSKSLRRYFVVKIRCTTNLLTLCLLRRKPSRSSC